MKYRCGIFWGRGLPIPVIARIKQVRQSSARESESIAMHLRTLPFIAVSVALMLAAVQAVSAAQPSAKPSPVTNGKPAAAPTLPASKPMAVRHAVAASAPGKPVVAPASRSGIAPLDRRTQELKREVARLNSDLQVIEQELLYPPADQVAVVVSVNVPTSFKLNAIQLEIDGQAVADHVYTPQELKSLQQGGVQRLYQGVLAAGTHELSATVMAGNAGADYKRLATLKFDKGGDAKLIQLRMDEAAGGQPDLSAKVWR